MLFKSLVLCLALSVPTLTAAQHSSDPHDKAQSKESGNSRQKSQSDHNKNTQESAKGRNEKDKEAKKHDQSKPEEFSASDETFLKAIIQEDISEIQLAQMALTRSTHADVKQYAQTKILGADPQMRADAEKILKEHGIQPPTEPTINQREMYDKLGKKSELFDNDYMVYEATQQRLDAKLVDVGIKSTKNSDVKSYATQEKDPVEKAASDAADIVRKIAAELKDFRQVAPTVSSARAE